MSDEKKLDPKVVYDLIEQFKEKAVHQTAASYIECVQVHLDGYAEPGYSDPDSGVICTGNWNKAGYGEEVEDKTAQELGDALTELGVEIEWEDEWTTCSRCNKLVRTQPDSYSWQRSYVVIDECDEVCHECLGDEAEEFLASLEGKDSRVNTIESINPADHGYVNVGEQFEHGFHHGQDADPKKIGAALREMGISRYLFNLDDTGQFDMRFSVWVHQDEADKFDAAKFNDADKRGVSPAKMAEEGLRKVDMSPPTPGHIKVNYVDLGDGSVSTEEVPGPQFIKQGLQPPEPPHIVEEKKEDGR